MTAEDKRIAENKKTVYQKIARDKKIQEERTNQAEERTPGCQNYFGYLGNRKRNQEIPQECIECQKSIECMLNKNEQK